MPSASAPIRPDTFEGFRPEAIQFLADLALNNDRAWFTPRKAEYEALLKRPLEALIVAVAERFAARGIPLTADPARSPFRIYRDVRFSKDKSPYKTNIGASFPWADVDPASGEPRHGAGGYFHLQPGDSFVGGGMWHPEKPRLDAFRAIVDRQPERIDAVLHDRDFASMYDGLIGDSLQRIPAGYPADHPRADLLRLKDVGVWRKLGDDELGSPALADVIADALAAAVPLFRLLASLDDGSR
jgi:uncharacterized protein (TIGR02453 family)